LPVITLLFDWLWLLELVWLFRPNSFSRSGRNRTLLPCWFLRILMKEHYLVSLDGDRCRMWLLDNPLASSFSNHHTSNSHSTYMMLLLFITGNSVKWQLAKIPLTTTTTYISKRGKLYKKTLFIHFTVSLFITLSLLSPPPGRLLFFLNLGWLRACKSSCIWILFSPIVRAHSCMRLFGLSGFGSSKCCYLLGRAWKPPERKTK
jgi:hypothetical protein